MVLSIAIIAVQAVPIPQSELNSVAENDVYHNISKRSQILKKYTSGSEVDQSVTNSRDKRSPLVELTSELLARYPSRLGDFDIGEEEGDAFVPEDVITKRVTRSAKPNEDVITKRVTRSAEPNEDVITKRVTRSAEPYEDVITKRVTRSAEPYEDVITKRVTRSAEPYEDVITKRVTRSAKTNDEKQPK